LYILLSSSSHLLIDLLLFKTHVDQWTRLPMPLHLLLLSAATTDIKVMQYQLQELPIRNSSSILAWNRFPPPLLPSIPLLCISQGYFQFYSQLILCLSRKWLPWTRSLWGLIEASAKLSLPVNTFCSTAFNLSIEIIFPCHIFSIHSLHSLVIVVLKSCDCMSLSFLLLYYSSIT
jgi:hypothetical protein